MSVWQSRALTLVLLGLLALFSIHLSHQWLEGARADLTANDLYSLSQGTGKILERMQQEGVKPVEITLYFSRTTGKTLPKFIKDFITYERYVRHLLGEYRRSAQGKIRLRFVDPVPDSDEAQDAADFGLDGKLINQHGDLFYFGLVFQTQTGSKDVIDFLWPSEQESIEYQISKKLHDLLWPSSRRIGVLSSLQVLGGATDPYMAQMLAAQGRRPPPKWIALQLLEESYEVTAIPDDVEEISGDEYDLVVVIHPKDLSGKLRWALDKWIVTGGNTLIFLDPYALADRPPQNPQQPWAALQYRPASGLDELLEAWGLRLADDEFAADLDLAVKRQLVRRGPAETVVVDLRITEETKEETLDTSHPVLQGISELRFLLAGRLDPIEGVAADGEGDGANDPASAAIERSWTATPFVTTTPSGNSLRIEPGFSSDSLAYTDLNDAAKLRDRLTPGGLPVALAYLLQGRLPSAYPQGTEYPSRETETPPGLPPGIELPPPDDAEMIRQEPVPEEERDEATVLLFADVDLISDQIAFIQSPLGIVQAANDNHRLLLNAADYLLGAPELMSVRTKGGLSLPFTLFDQIEAAAEKDTLERERALRADIETWQQELREKQGDITQRNAALLQKRLQDEIDRLNDKVQEANRELRQIRQSRRQALEREETTVRVSVMGWMPTLILAVGIYLAVRRRTLHRQAIAATPTSRAGPPPARPLAPSEDPPAAAGAAASGELGSGSEGGDEQS